MVRLYHTLATLFWKVLLWHAMLRSRKAWGRAQPALYLHFAVQCAS